MDKLIATVRDGDVWRQRRMGMHQVSDTSAPAGATEAAQQWRFWRDSKNKQKTIVYFPPFNLFPITYKLDLLLVYNFQTHCLYPLSPIAQSHQQSAVASLWRALLLALMLKNPLLLKSILIKKKSQKSASKDLNQKQKKIKKKKKKNQITNLNYRLPFPKKH